MKIVFTSVIINCFSILLLFSQNNVLADDFKFEEVVQVDSLSKEKLYQNAKHWTLATLKSSDNFIHLDDEHYNSIIATGNLMLKGASKLCGIINGPLTYKITIMFKDGRYKYTIDNMVCRYVIYCGEFGAIPVTAPLEDIKLKNKLKAKIYDEIDQKLKLLIADLKQSIVSPKVGEDW